MTERLNGMTRAAGQGMVEILIAIVCFIAAALPIISIFSLNMENTKVIQSKATTYAAASELINQVVLIPVNLLKMRAGGVSIPIPAAGKTFTLVDKQDRTRLFLTPLPNGFTREISIDQRDDDLNSFRVVVKVKAPDQPRADLEISQTVSQNLGGR